VDVVEVLVIDDGSCDRTVEVARELGASNPLHENSMWLGARLPRRVGHGAGGGARILSWNLRTRIINTTGADIVRLANAMSGGSADIVGGRRGVATIEYFSRQRLATSGLQLGRAVGFWHLHTRCDERFSAFSAIGIADERLERILVYAGDLIQAARDTAGYPILPGG